MADGKIWDKDSKTKTLGLGAFGHFRVVYRNDTLDFCGVMVHKKAPPGQAGFPFVLCTRSGGYYGPSI